MSDNAPTVGGDVSELPSDSRAMTEAQVMEGIEGLLDDKPKKQTTADAGDPGVTGGPAAAEEQGVQDPKPGPEDPATREEEEEEPYEPDLEPVGRGRGVWTIKGSSRQIVGVTRTRKCFVRSHPKPRRLLPGGRASTNKAFTQKTA